MMSVPMRSQSGASVGSSRIQLCRSVVPGGNGVPGGTIGTTQTLGHLLFLGDNWGNRYLRFSIGDTFLLAGIVLAVAGV